jgi:hypothetical protein
MLNTADALFYAALERLEQGLDAGEDFVSLPLPLLRAVADRVENDRVLLADLAESLVETVRCA